jgi:hypothetical protein
MKGPSVVLMLPGLALCAAILVPAALGAGTKDSKRWTDSFNTSSCAWSSTGKNDFFILEPGYQQVLEGREGKESVHLEITVLAETRTVGGVETRIIEEKESHNGRVEEISRNLYAVCGPGSDVFYFGEEVDMYKDGKIAGHEGAWIANTAGAKAGLFMPSRPLLGARFFQEIAPGVALDRVEVVSDSESLKTPAGTFDDCLKTEETTPIEPQAKEYKVYARGVGIVQDDQLLLVKYGIAGAQKP